MSIGLDYVSGPSIDDLKAARINGNPVTFVCRYLAPVNVLTRVKLLTDTEAKALSQAGIALVSNFEWYAARALEGVAAGRIDAQIAADQHAACGGEATRPIYFSVDADVQGAQVAGYFQGVADTIGLARTGAYGSEKVLKYLFDNHLITWGWQTYAWSGGLWEPRAHIRQYQNSMSLAGARVDYNESMKPDFGQWIIGGSTPPMQHYTPQAADFGAFFSAPDADHWKCKQTGFVVQFGIKDFYSSLSMDGNSLPVVGLPLTNEIYLTFNGKNVVLQIFERAGIYYDPAGAKDHQPGTGMCSLCHLTDLDFVKNVPGLTLPALSPVDTSALIAAINAIADGVAKDVALALVEVKKL